MKKISKKGQTHMTETIAVIFIFFILVMFGIIFYYKYQQVSFNENQEKLLATQAMEKTLKVLFLPELMCSNGEAEPEDNCFDMLKLRQINETFKDHLDDYYFDIFSYGKVTVQEVYPENKTYVLYDKEKVKENENGTLMRSWERKESTYFVVTLRDEIKGGGEAAYGYGYMQIEVFS